MSRTRQTRRERNRQIDRFQLYKPFIFYTAVLSLMQLAVVRSGASTPAGAAALFVVGLLTWGLYEYVTHRWVLHREPKAEGFNLPGNLTHLRHHAEPDSLQRLNVQLSESVPVCVVYFLAAWALAGSWQAATHLYTGLIAGYFFYEYLDFQAHHGTSRGRLTRYFRKYHLQHHHHDATVRFGVTSPLFDYLFGTFHIEKRGAQPRPRATAQAAGAGRGIS
ncbi:MAG TPA: sterol desaturase family protein [Pyrinomonadaceae bacterium]|jgi:sterol desaturase/sphingolipid hydroxylase (fatty acid hydroxylase superfamily)